MSINRVVISGNLTADAALNKTTSSQTDVLNFSVAVNDRRKNQQTGEWEDYPNFLDCSIFGNRAKGLSQFLKKGTKVTIEGKLRWSQWETEGKKRSRVSILCDEVEFVTRSRSQDTVEEMPASAVLDAAPVNDASAGVYDEDIPF